MNDDQLRQAYSRHLADGSRAGRERCVAPEALVALVERRGIESERLVTLDHAMGCDECRRDLELLRAVAAASDQQAVSATWAGHFRFTASGFRLAATLALLVVGGSAAYLLARRDGEIMRGGDGARNFAIVAPAGPVAATQAGTLIWRAAPGARRYQVELLTATGDSIFAVTSVDTVVSLPSTLALERGSEYLWTVLALMGDGSQAAAAPRRFRIQP